MAKVLVRSATYSTRNSSSMLPPSLVWRWWRLNAVARTWSRRGPGQQVAGQLPGDELVVRQIGVEGLDDPVAPGPHGAIDVGLVAVGVGVAGQVEPVDGHALAEPGRGQQAVDQALVGVRGRDRPGRRRSRRESGAAR